MNKYRKELGKYISYAKAHGVSVFFHDSKDGGGWVLDGSQIYISAKTPLMQWLILSHELGHHKQFVKDGMKVPKKIIKVLNKENMLEPGETLSKAESKLIYETEKNDAKNQLDIQRETRCTVPEWILHREIELDLWIYRVYWKTGNFPSMKERKEMRKSLTKKWKSAKIK